MGNDASLRRRLFDSGAAALARGRPDILKAIPPLKGQYACPVCLRAWPAEALTSDPRWLTLDEAPPAASSRGTMTRVLVCRGCNNTAGHLLEHELRKRRDAEDFSAGRLTGAAQVEFEVNDIRVPALARQDQGQITVIGIPSATNPQDLATHRSWLDAQVELGPAATGSFTIHLRPWDHRLSRVALLKAAYLVAFAAFGYWYILRSDFDPVRSEIREPGRGHIEALPILTDYSQKETTHRIIGVAAPIKALAYQIGHDVVLLPHIEPDYEFWDKMGALTAEAEGNLTCDKVGDWPRYPEYRLDPPYPPQEGGDEPAA